MRTVMGTIAQFARMSKIQDIDNIKCRQGCGDTITVNHFSWDANWYIYLNNSLTDSLPKQNNLPLI